MDGINDIHFTLFNIKSPYILWYENETISKEKRFALSFISYYYMQQYTVTPSIMDEQKIINNALHYILDILDPINHYPYHNINHTLDVYTRVGYLTDKE